MTAIFLFHIGVYITDTEDRRYLYFSLLVLSYMLILINRYIVEGGASFGIHATRIIDVVCVLLIAGFTVLFTHRIFNITKILWFTVSYYILLLLVGITSTVVLVATGNETMIRLVFNLVSAFYVLLFAFFIVTNAKRSELEGKSGNRPFVFGFILMLTNMFYMSVILAFDIYVIVWVSVIPFIVMCVIFTYGLIRDFRNLLAFKKGGVQKNPRLNTDQFCRKYEISEKQAKVLFLLASGSQYKEIASELFISIKTVEWYIRGIYAKTGVNRRIDLLHKIIYG
jgi:DNA-binding CsgD family transcriptional regulator